MAPKKSKRAATKAAPQVDIDSESDDLGQSQEPSQSQELSTKRLEELVKKQSEQSHARKAQRKKEIETNKKKSIEKIQKKINELKRSHEEELRTLRNPKVARLRVLIQRRREIDAKIAACWDNIDQAYESTIQQYQFALKGRLEGMD